MKLYVDGFKDLIMMTTLNDSNQIDNQLCYVISNNIKNIEIQLEALNSLTKYQTNISQESLLSTVETIIKFIKELIDKVINYFKIMYNKLVLRFRQLVIDGSDITKKLSTVRGKGMITISDTTFNYLKDNFKTLDINTISNGLDEINKLSLNYKSVVDKIINKETIEETLVYNDFITSIKVKSKRNGELEVINQSIDIPDNKIDIKNDTIKEVPYNLTVLLSESLDKTNDKLSMLFQDINRISDTVKKNVDELERTKEFNNSNTTMLKNLLIVQKTFPVNILKSYNTVMRKIGIALNMIYRDGVSTSDLLYKEFITNLKDQNYKNKLDFIDYLGDISKLKLIDNDKYLYFSMTGISKTDMIAGVPPAFTIPGYKIIEKGHKGTDPVSYTKWPTMVTTRKLLKEEEFDYNSIRYSGLIFICEDLINSLIRESNTKITFDYIYYHEVGHLLTRQEMYVYYSNPNNFFDIEQNPIELYIGNIKENKSDAYACLMTGISPEVVWDYRLWEFKNIIADLDEYQISENYLLPVNKLREWMESIEKRKIVYVNNVRKQMSIMEPYAKRGPMGWLKSLLTKRN